MSIRYLVLLLIGLGSIDVLPAQSTAERTYDSLLTVLNSGKIATDTQWITVVEGIPFVPPKSSVKRDLKPYVLKSVEIANRRNEATWRLRAYLGCVTRGNFPEPVRLRYIDTIMMLLPEVDKPGIKMLQAANQAEMVYFSNQKYVKALEAKAQWRRIAALQNEWMPYESDDAYIYQTIGRNDTAKKILQEILAKMSSVDSLHGLKANKYTSLATIYAKENKYDSATMLQRRYIEEYSQFLKHVKIRYSENFAVNMGVMAVYLLKISMPDSAAVYVDKEEEGYKTYCPDYSPRYRSVWCHRAQICIFKKEYKQALYWLDKADNHYKTYGNEWFYLDVAKLYGECYAKLGQWAKSLTWYEKAEQLAEEDRDVWLKEGSLLEICDSLSHIYEKTGNPVKAIAYLKRFQVLQQVLLADSNGKEIASRELSQKQAENNALEIQNQVQKQKTRWAIVGVVLMLILFGFAIFQLRQNRRLLKEIAYEKQRSEALLLNILPENIAARLKEDTRGIADAFEEATVIFIDIVGFTALSSKYSPSEMVHFLNDIFVRFDRITDQYGLEKIKTIGDCYMAVSGLPNPHPDHLQACIRMGLEVLRQAPEMHFFEHQVAFRIGIETGPVVAGIIGEKRFLYDLWGDVVNTASRMESNGVPNTIQVTENVYEKIKDQFDCRERGLVDIKGKGQMRTWLIG